MLKKLFKKKEPKKYSCNGERRIDENKKHLKILLATYIPFMLFMVFKTDIVSSLIFDPWIPELAPHGPRSTDYQDPIIGRILTIGLAFYLPLLAIDGIITLIEKKNIYSVCIILTLIYVTLYFTVPWCTDNSRFAVYLMIFCIAATYFIAWLLIKFF